MLLRVVAAVADLRRRSDHRRPHPDPSAHRARRDPSSATLPHVAPGAVVRRRTAAPRLRPLPRPRPGNEVDALTTLPGLVWRRDPLEQEIRADRLEAHPRERRPPRRRRAPAREAPAEVVAPRIVVATRLGELVRHEDELGLDPVASRARRRTSTRRRPRRRRPRGAPRGGAPCATGSARACHRAPPRDRARAQRGARRSRRHPALAREVLALREPERARGLDVTDPAATRGAAVRPGRPAPTPAAAAERAAAAHA